MHLAMMISITQYSNGYINNKAYAAIAKFTYEWLQCKLHLQSLIPAIEKSICRYISGLGTYMYVTICHKDV